MRAPIRAALIVSLTLAAATPARADERVSVLPVADRAPGERRPLLVYLHGLGGSGAEALASPALRALAERLRMIVIAPDGHVGHDGNRFWNAGGACCNFDGQAVDDVARLEALIDHWRQRPEVDPARVFVVGFSNGGFMAHRLACWMDDRLAAVVSLGGAGRARDQPCGVTSPLAVLEVHGDADPIVRYGGGRVFDRRDLDPFPSASDTVHDWAARLGCAAGARPRVTTLDLDPQLGGAETTVESYRGCPGGTAELWTIHGAGHHVVTPEVLAEVGRFLAAHPKPDPRAGKTKDRTGKQKK